MKKLEEMILEKGKALNKEVLKVDSFLNHQVDVKLMDEIGEEFADYFRTKEITKVVTIESSGIAPATMVAKYLEVPLVILKKQTSKILNDDYYQTTVESFTKGTSYELTVSKKYISNSDNILIIDDFLAHGEASMGAIRLIEKLEAKVAGVGIVIEKSFQPGRRKLEEYGMEVYSLARVKRLDENVIEFI